MPSILVTKGSAALQRLTNRIRTQADLATLVAGKDPAGSVQSCAINASVIGDAVSDAHMQVVPCFGLSNQQKITRIAALLCTPQLVYVNITPDHHFVFFAVDDDKVVILQGFQGVYDFVEWYENRGGGIMRKDEFLRAMASLVSSDGARLEAAVDLFSYRLSGHSSPTAARVEQEVRAYFGTKPVEIVVMGHKPL